MHPNEFKKKWNLSDAQLASVLRYDEYTVRCWRREGKKHREPMPIVDLVCELLDQIWSKQEIGKNFGQVAIVPSVTKKQAI